MSSQPSPQAMKPLTAAKKLDVYLPATPPDFQANAITREELAALELEPPEWLQELRRNGPHPKNLVAAKLGISVTALARNEITDALTTEQIKTLLDQMPDWLAHERETAKRVREEDRKRKAASED
ncbi:hypothetical protein GOEFS_064_00030 [Gordonia effusa NBRC 100432]|uniref:Uncharacterized protein n=1 Tax=Gordonia effusa NBRC 100432 TaxID=1077974 RepID=H0R113_9ACTN|nr:DUF5997 family protein [Gordonia effusa]GAB18764.1 hypothetical protein GOEFS_064_00030 [Gordonia effusa NBRC 100432]